MNENKVPFSAKQNVFCVGNWYDGYVVNKKSLEK
jgi:hypothetical protein